MKVTVTSPFSSIKKPSNKVSEVADLCIPPGNPPWSESHLS